MTALTFGNYDGLHLGHMYLITATTRRASELGLTSVAYTFSEHPQNVLSNALLIKRLTSPDEKREILSRTAVDSLYFENFDPAFAALSPEEFVRAVLVERFAVRLVVVGSDCRFGRKGLGTVADLKRFGETYGFAVETVESYLVDDLAVSSSRIRGFISSGKVEKAAPLLGRLYSLLGRLYSLRDEAVYRGGPDGSRGRAAYATKLDGRMETPKDGAYITRVKAGDKLFEALASVCGLTAYVYPIGRHGDLHGAQIEIFFYVKIRDAEPPRNAEPPRRADEPTDSDFHEVKRYFGI